MSADFSNPMNSSRWNFGKNHSSTRRPESWRKADQTLVFACRLGALFDGDRLAVKKCRLAVDHFFRDHVLAAFLEVGKLVHIRSSMTSSITLRRACGRLVFAARGHAGRRASMPRR